MNIKTQKSRARLQAKQKRAQVHNGLGHRFEGGVALIEHFPAVQFRRAIIGGYWPLPGEIDIRPLLGMCHEAGHALSLPTTPRKGYPLTFRRWKPSHRLKSGAYNTKEPYPEQPEVKPSLVLVPLLAFTQYGERLGYGGGFYDRTLTALKSGHDVFACGVAYAGQEAATLPTDQHDQRLDGILTEAYFKAF